MSVEEKKPQPCYWNAALLLLFKNKQKRKLGCFCPASLIFYHPVLFQLQPTAPVILTLYTAGLCLCVALPGAPWGCSVREKRLLCQPGFTLSFCVTTPPSNSFFNLNLLFLNSLFYLLKPNKAVLTSSGSLTNCK